MSAFRTSRDLPAAPHAAFAAFRDPARLGDTILLEGMELPGWGRITIHEFGGVQQGLWQLP